MRLASWSARKVPFHPSVTISLKPSHVNMTKFKTTILQVTLAHYMRIFLDSRIIKKANRIIERNHPQVSSQLKRLSQEQYQWSDANSLTVSNLIYFSIIIENTKEVLGC